MHAIKETAPAAADRAGRRAEPAHDEPWRIAVEPDRRRRLSPAVIAGFLRIADLVALFASGLALHFGYNLVHGASLLGGELDRYSLVTVIGAVAAVVLLGQAGSYDFARLRRIRWQAAKAAAMWSAVGGIGLIIAFATKTTEHYSRAWVLGWYATGGGLLVANRVALALQLRAWTRQGKLSRSVVVVGAGELGVELLQTLRAMVDENIRVVGVFDDRQSRVPAVIAGQPVLGTTDDLMAFARTVPVDEIIVALPLSAEARLQTLFQKLRLLPVDLRLSLGPIADRLTVRGVSHIGHLPALDIAERPLKHWAGVAKWLEDKILSGAILLAAAPLMAAIAAAIKLDSRGPVFFVQERFGFNNEVIRVLKFRTMYVDRGDPSGAQQTVKDDPRVTRIGRILRSWSLDELPQLINVAKGDMSLVGPRPHALTMKAAGELYFDAVKEYFLRHHVKPGLTGWAQVNGLRGETDTIEKARGRVAYDLEYIEKWSLWLDLKIILASFRVFIARENAY